MYLFTETEREANIETLENGLVISVNRSDGISMPIISISVAVGHYHETDHCYGFSHLLEHMIFHRSKTSDVTQNIEINTNRDLEKLVAEHHGYINAWTHSSHTNFHFTCAKEGFSEASQLLIHKVAHPLFEKSAIETEIAAIEEEYRLKLKDPVRAMFSVKKCIASKEHPFHRFTVGNRETLEQASIEVLQTQLISHHQEYFHSGNIAVDIHLPINGDHSKDILSIKTALLQNFVSKTANFYQVLPPLYPSELTHSWVHVNIKYSHSQLILCWFVKKHESLLDNSALGMVRHLIESKHKNGLFDTLNHAHHLRAISFTNGIEQADEHELQLHLTLSTEGEKNRHKVVRVVSQFLSFLAGSQLANWRFDELKKQQELIEAHSTNDPVETCVSHAQSLHQHAQNNEDTPIDARISYHQVKQRVNDIFDVLQNKAHQVFVVSDSFEKSLEDSKQYSPFYQVPFAISNSPVSFELTCRHETSANFRLAPQNIYMPSRLLSVTAEIPVNTLQVMNHHGVLLKFGQIVREGQAHGDCFVSINNASMCDTLQHTMSKKIWVEGFANYCKKRFYQAIDAGISFRVYGHQHGVTLHTTGFSDKQIDFLLELIDCALHFKLNEDEFLQVKNAILKRLTTRLFNKPINRMFAHLTTFVQGTTYSVKQQVSAVNDLSFDSLSAHQEQFFKQNCVESLVVGNWRLYCVQKLHQQLQARLTAKGIWEKPSIQAASIPIPCMPQLPELDNADEYPPRDKEKDCALVLYQQVRALQTNIYTSQRAQAVCLILEHILGPHIFARLRKDMQLAYLVGVGYKPINSQAGLVVYLQSSTSDAARVYQAVCKAVKELIDDWDETSKEIEHAKPGIAHQCQPLDRDISNIAMRLWANYDEPAPYLQYQQLQKALMEISPEEIKCWLQKLSATNEGQVLLCNDRSAFEHETLSGFSLRPKIK